MENLAYIFTVEFYRRLMWGYYVNPAMAEDGCSVIFVKDKKPMSKLEIIAFIVAVQLVEP